MTKATQIARNAGQSDLNRPLRRPAGEGAAARGRSSEEGAAVARGGGDGVFAAASRACEAATMALARKTSWLKPGSASPPIRIGVTSLSPIGKGASSNTAIKRRPDDQAHIARRTSSCKDSDSAAALDQTMRMHWADFISGGEVVLGESTLIPAALRARSIRCAAALSVEA